MEQKMQVTVVALLPILSCYFASCWGLSCYQCTAPTNYNGEKGNTGDCFVAGSATPNCSSSGSNPYCQTMFNIWDGVVVGVTRRCQSGESDEDENTDKVPGDTCETVLDTSGNPTSSSFCYVSCNNKNNCNTQTASGLKECSSNCSYNAINVKSQGSCNYIEGKCVCNPGYTGTDCSVEAGSIATAPSTAKINCYQCSTEYDTGCSDLKGLFTVPCPGQQPYCSTTTTNIYDSDLNIAQTVTVRGCTDTLVAADECTITNIYADPPIEDVGYNEYTCYSTCDQPGCNKNTADGQISSGETEALYCYQCSDSASCQLATSRTICPSEAKYCTSTVTYIISDKSDLHYLDENPTYQLVSIVRGCSVTSLSTKCVTKSKANMLTHHVCTESCVTDGCNSGWPARPQCITCSSDTISQSSYDQCLENPPEPASCEYPYQAYCFVQDKGMIEDKGTSMQGYPRRITRGCTFHDYGSACSTQSVLGKNIQTCNYTCGWDGCNVGNGADGNLLPFASFAMVSLFSLLGQKFLL